MQLHSHVIAATSAEKLILIYSRIQAPRCPGVISPGSGTWEPNLLLPWLWMFRKGLASQVSLMLNVEKDMSNQDYFSRDNILPMNGFN